MKLSNKENKKKKPRARINQTQRNSQQRSKITDTQSEARSITPAHVCSPDDPYPAISNIHDPQYRHSALTAAQSSNICIPLKK